MFKPECVAFDYETIDINTGLGSTEFYQDNFRVHSAAFSWRDQNDEMKSRFILGEDNVKIWIKKFEGCKFIAHNLQFEMGVSKCRYPDLDINWYADTMRLVQVYDNGGNIFDLIKPLRADQDMDLDSLISEMDGDLPDFNPRTGLGLEAAISRILPRKYHSHKKPHHDWILENVKCRKGEVGRYLTYLPHQMMVEYNIADTENTLRLYEKITREFEVENYNWLLDHTLYKHSVKLIVDSKISGSPTNREGLETYREEVANEIAGIETTFTSVFRTEIKQVERDRKLKEIGKRKTLRGKKSFLRSYRNGNPRSRFAVDFNIGSNTQLASLFTEKLGMKAKFTTEKGNPSFKSAMLSQWGEGGEVLKKRRKRLLVLKQTENLLELTKYDGRFHADLKACGTATGRFAGGSAV